VKLPYVGSNPHIGIECHPKKKELLYPCSDAALSIYSIGFADTITKKQYYPHITEKSSILRAFYSPEGDDIALLTDKHKIFIYNPKNDTTISIRESDGSTYSNCKNPIFVPESNVIAFSGINCRTMHFYDFKKKEFIPSRDCDYSCDHHHVFINNIDFSPDAKYIISIDDYTGKIGPTSSNVINHIKNLKLFSCYCILKTYTATDESILSLDIIRLLIQQLGALYGV
jgi:WD40 repeat protein